MIRSDALKPLAECLAPRSSQRAEAKINELKDKQMKKLEEKLIHKNEVIAELMEENVKAKKANGDL